LVSIALEGHGTCSKVHPRADVATFSYEPWPGPLITLGKPTTLPVMYQTCAILDVPGGDDGCPHNSDAPCGSDLTKEHDVSDSKERATEWTGGCQCGAVRYQLLTPPEHASICHCRMCQKASGTDRRLDA